MKKCDIARNIRCKLHFAHIYFHRFHYPLFCSGLIPLFFVSGTLQVADVTIGIGVTSASGTKATRSWLQRQVRPQLSQSASSSALGRAKDRHFRRR